MTTSESNVHSTLLQWRVIGRHIRSSGATLGLSNGTEQNVFALVIA